MVAIRRLQIDHFRGFDSFGLSLPPHAVLTGEPGAGRSDLIEALIRLLDPDYPRQRHGEELDFYQGDTDVPVRAEVVLGALSDAQARALSQWWEWWDPESERLITEATPVEPVDPDRHERVVRIAYRMVLAADGRFDERVYWPKKSQPEHDIYEAVRTAERAFIPFFWQRGLTSRPLDLAGRGELRSLIDKQTGEDFSAAVERFMSEVADASARFSEQERVKAALEAVFEPLRRSRRIRDEAASELVRFLPDGGAPSGLLRTLAAAVTLSDGPEFLPAARHGATLMGALRAGTLLAAARYQEGAVVVVDDFGGEFDPHLSMHLAREMRALAGQTVVATRMPSVIDAFRIEEIVRLHFRDGRREVARGPASASRAERIAAYYYAGRLTRVLAASAVILVDGVHDRLALEGLERRAVAVGALSSLAAAGIAYVDVGGSGDLGKVAEAAKHLGLYTVVLLDNDQARGASPNASVQAASTKADVCLWLPPRCKLEWALTEGVSDEDLQSALTALRDGMPDIAVPQGFEAMSGVPLQRAAISLLHGNKGSVHAAFVEALDERRLAPTGVAVLAKLRELATARTEVGLVQWT